MVKPLEGLLQTGGQYPRLRPKQEHRLHPRHIETPCRSLIVSLPSQDLHQPYQFPPCPPEVPFHRQLIVISGQQCLSQVPEWRDRHQWFPMRQEDPPHMLLHILNQKSPSLPLWPALAHFWSRVWSIEGFLCNKYVTLGAPGVGLIPLLRYYYAAPRVSVVKVYPEVFPWGRCPLSSLHRSPQSGKYIRKWHSILCWCPVLIPTPPPPRGGRWGGLSVPNCRKQPGLQVDSTLMAMDPLVESLPIGESQSVTLQV